MFFRKSLTNILSGFEKLAADLEAHLERAEKKHVKLSIFLQKIEAEAAQAERVLERVREFVA